MPSQQQKPDPMDPSFGKYAGAMANFALIRVEAVNI